MHVEPYLYFNGRCEEAVQFYRQAVGADGIELLRFSDAPEPPPPGAIPPGYERKIMHGVMRIGDSTIMMSDGRGNSASGFQNFGLTIIVHSEADTDRVFQGLANGGTVLAPLGKTFFSPRFGMVTDRFGVSWLVLTRST